MAGEEEQLLRQYLASRGVIGAPQDDAAFSAWYDETRESPDGEIAYKHTLEVASVWLERYGEGWRDGVAYANLPGAEDADDALED